MYDFLRISTRMEKGRWHVRPEFLHIATEDIMIRGDKFYAIWDPRTNLWSLNEQTAIDVIDHDLATFADENRDKLDGCVVEYLRECKYTGIDRFKKFCNSQMMNIWSQLDENIIFADQETSKRDYATKKLKYSLSDGPCPAYERLISTLYSPEERHKIEWAIGSVVCGDSKKLQKFFVLYGAAGTGKSTILNLIQQLFDGYFCAFVSRDLGSENKSFALSHFKDNPLVGIDQDGDLSRLETNTRLNSLVAHDIMPMEEKFKSPYPMRFNSLLFIGTNKPVKITDAKSGLIRRLIDISPTGKKLPASEYNQVVGQLKFELGEIANRCLKVYEEDPHYYDNYIPTTMMGATNDFYNFVEDSYFIFEKDDKVTLKAAWEMYNNYNAEAKVLYPMPQRAFKEELKNYFAKFEDRGIVDGERVRSLYSEFKKDKFEEFTRYNRKQERNELKDYSWLNFDCEESKFDILASDYPAQLTKEDGTPLKSWDKVTTTLKDISSSELHYIRVPENHIVIDFDIPDSSGNKCLALNLIEANKFPPTYAELSKSGQGIHLHYIYKGDVSKLSRIYDEHIEVKVFTGKSSLRRKLTKCNDLDISAISTGLPLKEEKPVVSQHYISSEKSLRLKILRGLNREVWPNTAPSINFINAILDEAYNDGVKYDVTDMRDSILAFAAGSTHQAQKCLKIVANMKFRSKEECEELNSTANDISESRFVFYDVEVFPNLFLVNWKFQGDAIVHRMINPSAVEIENLIKYKLIGFNCRRYDNHILYGRLIGLDNYQLYLLSKKIIDPKTTNDENKFYPQAYNLSYLDIYDMSSKKQSLKKFEIELGIIHKELGLPWDQPVPEELWEQVAEYCDNDVIATEAVFNDRQADYTARLILADLAEMPVNSTTNQLTTKIIFGKDKNPQSTFNYRNMAELHDDDIFVDGFDEFTRFNSKGQPVFPGYEFIFENNQPKSTYRGVVLGEGGNVYSEPGMYLNVALLDIASMHPSSIIAEELFGPYTARYRDILNARIFIKHKEFDKAREIMNGALKPYLDDESKAKALAQALKLAINSVYGLTDTKFINPFRDIRNIDNIVAKRGALFMENLKHEVQKRGFTVVHIKTDSIKIANATDDIIRFVMDYGKLYGYNFEHEATYEKLCIVNDAVYVAKDISDGHWTATGTQFQVPYVFKTLFSHEPIEFKDMCETKSVNSALYLDMNEGLGEDEHSYQFIGKVGLFTPMKEGVGAGLLLRQTDTGYSSANGSKGYRWMESPMVQSLGLEDSIDKSYYNKLVDDAVHDISQYGDFEWFAA